MSDEDRSARPWIVAALVCAAALAILILRAMQFCGGHFGYPMDDTYIHMAMAKNFSAHGVWGTTRYGFTSSTSSPAYTFLLAACYFITGVREITPLLLNLLAGALLLMWCNFVLTRAGLSPKWRTYLLVILVFSIPLPILILGGMEHTLHALLTLIFVHFCCLQLASGEASARIPVAALMTFSAVLVLTRFEGVFLVVVAGCLFLLQRRWFATLAVAFGSAAAVVAYGAVSMAHGWFPLPTSLLLKANLPSTPSSGMYPSFLLSLFRNASRGSHVVMLVVIAGALIYSIYRSRRTIWTYNGIGLILFIATALLHLTFARTGWFFRYEAYLVALGIVVCASAIAEAGFPLPRKGWAVAVVVLACLLTARTAYAFYVAPQAVADIYGQQYQMGLFARAYLNGKTLLINDIGAVSFLSEARVLDLIGLGSLDPALARVHQEYSTDWLKHWVAANHADAAIIYPHLAPADWHAVCTWTIPGNYMSGSDSVNFFALNPAFQQQLISDLNQFRPKLPARVVVQNR